MKKIKPFIIPVLVPFIFVFSLCVVFSFGRKIEREKQNSYWMKDFKIQQQTVDILSKKAIELKATYDSIKKSDCYKNTHFKK